MNNILETILTDKDLFNNNRLVAKEALLKVIEADDPDIINNKMKILDLVVRDIIKEEIWYYISSHFNRRNNQHEQESIYLQWEYIHNKWITSESYLCNNFIEDIHWSKNELRFLINHTK